QTNTRNDNSATCVMSKGCARCPGVNLGTIVWLRACIFGPAANYARLICRYARILRSVNRYYTDASDRWTSFFSGAQGATGLISLVVWGRIGPDFGPWRGKVCPV